MIAQSVGLITLYLVYCTNILLKVNRKLQDSIIFLLNLQQELKCCLINLPTNSMEQSPSWEADSSSTDQEISLILLNHKFHYPAHKSLPLPPIVSHSNPLHARPTHLFMIHFNIILPTMSRSPKVFCSDNTCRIANSYLHARCIAHTKLEGNSPFPVKMLQEF